MVTFGKAVEDVQLLFVIDHAVSLRGGNHRLRQQKRLIVGGQAAARTLAAIYEQLMALK
jgi:hypothetical protein